jgi:hypothetical protein
VLASRSARPPAARPAPHREHRAPHHSLPARDRPEDRQLQARSAAPARLRPAGAGRHHRLRRGPGRAADPGVPPGGAGQGTPARSVASVISINLGGG